VRTMVCYDAGFVHLGIMVAKLPEIVGEMPEPIHISVSEAALPNKLEFELRSKSVTFRNIHRILKQVDVVEKIHHRFKPVAYYVEMPHGGAKGALAIRGMSFATAYLATAIHLLAPRVLFHCFSPFEVKKAVTGDGKADKLVVAQRVIDTWPAISNWPGFKIVTVIKRKKGAKLEVQKKALAHDATDAGAVCITATQHPTYSGLFLAGRQTCQSELDLSS